MRALRNIAIIALLALIVLYKLGDAFAGALTTAFLIRGAGFSATEVGARGPHARDDPPEPTYADHLLAEFRPEMS